MKKRKHWWLTVDRRTGRPRQQWAGTNRVNVSKWRSNCGIIKGTKIVKLESVDSSMGATRPGFRLKQLWLAAHRITGALLPRCDVSISVADLRKAMSRAKAYAEQISKKKVLLRDYEMVEVIYPDTGRIPARRAPITLRRTR